MYKDKKMLLIAGGGTLGMYTAKELLAQGARVDIICLEDHTTEHEGLRFWKQTANFDTLSAFLQDKQYDGIVNFLHYPNAEDYKASHALLCEHAEHLIILSSYRVYADEQHPITENAPRLLDVSSDRAFVEQEQYAISKAVIENIARADNAHKNWTIVRPVISFSALRFDLFMYSGGEIVQATEEGKTLYLPACAKHLTAGWDWAGNSGKLIANLLLKKDAFGEAFTVSSAQNLTWGQVAEVYRVVTGLSVAWVDADTYLASVPDIHDDWWWRYLYDRLFDRVIDNRKILSVTGLSKEDFLSTEEGLRLEWEKRSS